jgi:tetratricopeptide (TPR) repeat protein
MLENLVDISIEKVTNEVITDAKMQDIPLAYITTRNIPDSVKHFLNQEVEIWIREEEEKFSSNDRFDYDQPEVRMLIDQIFDNLKQNARFHQTKFNQLLERAVKLELNYLIEPHRTLSQFIFKNNQIVSTMEVYDTLKYFFKFGYYKDAISEYFNSKYLREISEEQFGQLISQIDENAFKEDLLETTLKTIKSITGFISEALDKEVETIELEVLLHAFQDRNLDTYIQLIEDLKKQGDTEIALADLELILNAESLDPLKQPEIEEVTATVTADEKPGDDTLQIEAVEDIEESKPVIAVDDIEVGEIKPEELVEEEEEEEEDETVEQEAPTPASGSVADDMANFVASQIRSDKPLEDLNSMVLGRTRKKIIKKLFNRKENEFLSFVDVVNEQSAWKDASVVIDNEFYERGINPYSKEAIMFSDLIYVRFFPKDRYVGEQ